MKANNIIYLVSQYPTITETFIYREIKEIEKSGSRIFICEIKPKRSLRNNQRNDYELDSMSIFRMDTKLVDIFTDIGYSLKNSRNEFTDCIKELLYSSIGRPKKFFHLLYIFISAIRYHKIIKSLNINFIRAHFLHTESIAAYWLSKLAHIPYSITAHVIDIYHDQKLIQKVAANAAFTVAITQQMQTHLEKLGSKNIFLIHNGISISEFPIISSKKDLPPLILGIGSLVECKGFNYLLRSCNLLKLEGIDFKCALIGEGFERQNLEDLICRLSLHDRVLLLGSKNFNDVKRYLRRATLLVMPSVPTKNASDGLPTVIIEALATRVPVIASNYAGIPDIITDGVTGILVEPKDVDGLYTRIKYLLSNRKLQIELGNNGRELAEKEFNLEINIAILIKLIGEYS